MAQRDFPTDGYFVYVRRSPADVQPPQGDSGRDAVVEEDCTLGECRDLSRMLGRPLTEDERGLIQEVVDMFPGETGEIAAAELECILRQTLVGFTLTETALVRKIAEHAASRGVIIAL